MITQSGKKILEKFVVSAKNLLMDNITELLQQHYGIWADGHYINEEQLTNPNTDIVHTAQMLRERLKHIIDSLPESEQNKDQLAVRQLITEQAFTQLNRFCALRMCEERGLILESIQNLYDSAGFVSYDAIAQQLGISKYNRYKCYLLSIFDELSLELPAVFDRFSPYSLVFPDEITLIHLIEQINDTSLSDYYDEQSGTNINFWKEDETLGWMFQYYNSLEERRKMREESLKPRNSREMAIRNQFFTPEYVVRFLSDNSLGRIWYEMTEGKSRIGDELCEYMVRKPDEVLEKREKKEPTEILALDPTCGSMHFGLYLYDIFEYIYIDAYKNYPELLKEYRKTYNTEESFLHEIPRLILENNIFGCEIDPRALQIAALSLWLRAQKSYSEIGLQANERPLIKRSNLILAEAMPGNKRLLKELMQELDKPMQKLLAKIWDKMKFAGEAGLLYKMEQEIEEDIEYLRKNWSKINQAKSGSLFESDEERLKREKINEQRKKLRDSKEEFFYEIKERLQIALRELSTKMESESGYENALFTEDASRGLAFLELCQKRFDCIVMNPPFGEGSENTSKYLDDHYEAWCDNLVCAFFDRMQEMLSENGRLGAIFDRTVFVRSSYENFRKKNLCGYIKFCADTGWNVLDASVETSTLVLDKYCSDSEGIFVDLRNVTENKSKQLGRSILSLNNNIIDSKEIFIKNSSMFLRLPNSIIGYFFDDSLLNIFQFNNMENRNLLARAGISFIAAIHPRLFYEIINSYSFNHYYNGGLFSLFYSTYRDIVYFNETILKSDKKVYVRNYEHQLKSGVGYGKRGEILDSHILKKSFFFSVEGFSCTNIPNSNSIVVLAFFNSIVTQYVINQYCGQHKTPGYTNLLPMPDYESKISEIEKTVKEIIEIKRHWFSLDETNLEYRGLIAQMHIKSSISEAIDVLQKTLTDDYEKYTELVRENDDIWMDLANIEKDSEFRKTLNDYKAKRPYEELISIDNATNQNIIDKKIIAQEIIQELVGMAFGRWNYSYAKGEEEIPPFGDIFDALPFMPLVSLDKIRSDYPLNIPEDGILVNDVDSPLNLAGFVRDVMHCIWSDKADDFEYELCQLIDFSNLQKYFENPSGFFDYHFKRYTKSRRKAPIYWPLSSEDGSITYWVYYPKLSKNTLPSLVVKLRNELEILRSNLNMALTAQDKDTESIIRAKQQQLENMMSEIEEIMNKNYEPNHNDGVPVTSAPLVKLIAHKGWNQECKSNFEELEKGEYDWSHLAYSMYPERVTNKAKKDWCLALTHGLEDICENKPKEKKSKKSKPLQPSLTME